MQKSLFLGAGSRAQRYLITGVITVIPIWITWAAFHFVGARLAELGAPWVDKLLQTLGPYAGSRGSVCFIVVQADVCRGRHPRQFDPARLAGDARHR